MAVPATSVCQLRHDHKAADSTEECAECSAFLTEFGV